MPKDSLIPSLLGIPPIQISRELLLAHQLSDSPIVLPSLEMGMAAAEVFFPRPNRALGTCGGLFQICPIVDWSVRDNVGGGAERGLTSSPSLLHPRGNVAAALLCATPNILRPVTCAGNTFIASSVSTAACGL
jgi:hypothetical protein